MAKWLNRHGQKHKSWSFPHWANFVVSGDRALTPAKVCESGQPPILAYLFGGKSLPSLGGGEPVVTIPTCTGNSLQ